MNITQAELKLLGFVIIHNTCEININNTDFNLVIMVNKKGDKVFVYLSFESDDNVCNLDLYHIKTMQQLLELYEKLTNKNLYLVQYEKIKNEIEAIQNIMDREELRPKPAKKYLKELETKKTEYKQIEEFLYKMIS